MAARRAKLELEGPGDWELVFKELNNEDVRSYASGTKKKGPGRRGIWEDGHEPPPESEPATLLESDSESDVDIEMDEGIQLTVAELTAAQMLKARKKGTGETKKKISWIWMTLPMSFKDGDEADDILWSEWACSRARSNRAREEVELLLKEMRRVLKFLEWKACWWDARLCSWQGVSPDLVEGLCSYARDQAAMHRSLSTSFRLLWKTPLRDVEGVLGDSESLIKVVEGAEDIQGDNEGDNEADDAADDEVGGHLQV